MNGRIPPVLWPKTLLPVLRFEAAPLTSWHRQAIEHSGFLPPTPPQKPLFFLPAASPLSTKNSPALTWAISPARPRPETQSMTTQWLTTKNLPRPHPVPPVLTFFSQNSPNHLTILFLSSIFPLSAKGAASRCHYWLRRQLVEVAIRGSTALERMSPGNSKSSGPQRLRTRTHKSLVASTALPFKERWYVEENRGRCRLCRAARPGR